MERYPFDISRVAKFYNNLYFQLRLTISTSHFDIRYSLFIILYLITPLHEKMIEYRSPSHSISTSTFYFNFHFLVRYSIFILPLRPCFAGDSPVFLRLKFSPAAGKFYRYENPGVH